MELNDGVPTRSSKTNSPACRGGKEARLAVLLSSDLSSFRFPSYIPRTLFFHDSARDLSPHHHDVFLNHRTVHFPNCIRRAIAEWHPLVRYRPVKCINVLETSSLKEFLRHNIRRENNTFHLSISYNVTGVTTGLHYSGNVFNRLEVVNVKGSNLLA